MDNGIRIGISTCLLGEKVRWNGGHKKDRFIVHTLGEYFNWVPVCPEVECGMGIPREPVRQIGAPDSPRLVSSKTGFDHTERMTTWAAKKVVALEKENLCGFIFRKDSPSSGMQRVKVYNDKGQPVKKGIGMFARAFMEHFPLVPVEEDGRLNDPKLRETFIEAVFVLKSWRETKSREKTMGRLVEFHTRQKLLILSHSPVHYRQMGKLVAQGKQLAPSALYTQYEALLVEALRLRTTVKKNVNVLQHMMGYFKRQLTADEKKELIEIIGRYHNEDIPLIVPVTLFNHYTRKYDQPYLQQQTYLNPHPLALKLRNHV